MGNHHYFTDINLSFLHSLVHGFILFSASEVREQTHIFKGHWKVEKISVRLRFWHKIGTFDKNQRFLFDFTECGQPPLLYRHKSITFRFLEARVDTLSCLRSWQTNTLCGCGGLMVLVKNNCTSFCWSKPSSNAPSKEFFYSRGRAFELFHIPEARNKRLDLRKVLPRP